MESPLSLTQMHTDRDIVRGPSAQRNKNNRKGAPQQAWHGRKSLVTPPNSGTIGRPWESCEHRLLWNWRACLYSYFTTGKPPQRAASRASCCIASHHLLLEETSVALVHLKKTVRMYARRRCRRAAPSFQLQIPRRYKMNHVHARTHPPTEHFRSPFVGDAWGRFARGHTSNRALASRLRAAILSNHSPSK